LYEGYALYPYTPGIAKNATPTPFGIVYPPAYACKLPGTTFDHLQIECVLKLEPGGEVEAAALFLQPSGERHKAVERRINLPRTSVESLASQPQVREFSFDGGESGTLVGTATLSTTMLRPGVARVTVRIENKTELPAGSPATVDRPKALQRSMISTHLTARAHGGRFVSPLEHKGELGPDVNACRNINSWPVLATEADDGVLGAAIMLPEHPQIAPESRLNFFDNTEIEEALVLHAQLLSDDDMEELKHQDPAVQDMIACARQVTPEELLNLHGRMTLADPEPLPKLNFDQPGFDQPGFDQPGFDQPGFDEVGLDELRSRRQTAPPRPPADFPDFADPRLSVAPEFLDPRLAISGDVAETLAGVPVDPQDQYIKMPPPRSGNFQREPPQPPPGYEDLPGEQKIEVDGRTFKRGDKVVLRLLMNTRQDPIDHMLNGKTATIERLFVDFDGKVHFGVTFDDDPGQELLRETGRFMFFFLDEVEVLPA
jgi:hypothetical protein